MIRMRPHHLLCVRAWRGKGYDERFAERMHRIVESLGAFPEVALVEGADDACEACPKLDAGGRCESEGKVARMDARVLALLDVAPGTYPYLELARAVDRAIDERGFDSVCASCEWYGLGWCKEAIVQRRAEG
jgi:hypothetical protein